MEQEAIGVGDRSRGRKIGWRGHKMKPETEGALQGRKEQEDEKSGARGWNSIEQGPNRSAEYLRRSGHSKGEASGLTASSGDHDFILGLEVQDQFFN